MNTGDQHPQRTGLFQHSSYRSSCLLDDRMLQIRVHPREGTGPLIGPTLEGPISIAGLLQVGLKAGPDELALVSSVDRWTWRALEKASGNLAGNFLALGLRPGDRVASLMPNSTVLLIYYLACMKAGLVAVPLNYRYAPSEIDHALDVSEASILLAHSERLAEIGVSEAAKRLPHGVISDEGGNPDKPSLSKLIEADAARAELPRSAPNDPALIYFTSGSTGPAKGVTHSREALGWMFASGAAALEVTPRDIVLPASSISHIAGCIFSFGALATGARVVVAGSYDSGEILSLLRGQRPTVLWMLPAALFSLARDQSAVRADFRSLRVCASGGDKVPDELQLEFIDLTGMPIDEGYGMTETGVAALNPPSGVIKVGSIGRPAPGVSLSIRDEDGREVPPGVEGRLWIKSRSITIGYWKDAAATAAIIRDGWLDSGDLMKADADGYLRFCSRRKQVIVHNGLNICPQEVEEALLQHVSVENACVVGVHDLLHGENVHAYVTTKDGVPAPGMQELIQFVRARVGHKAPSEIGFLREMPLSPVGKVDRAALKRMAAGASRGEHGAVMGSALPTT